MRQLQPKTYNYIDTANYTRMNVIGFIAQELFKIAPEAVAEGDYEDEIIKTWAIDNSKLVPALVKAIQEQQSTITSLQDRLDKLENK